MEHRWGQRFLLDVPASVADGNGWTVAARVRDISASGAFLECPPPLACITRVLIRFKGPGTSTILIGNVVRRTPEGVGIEWGEFAPAAVASLLQGVAYDATRVTTTVKGDPRVPQHPASRVSTLRHRERRAPR